MVWPRRGPWTVLDPIEGKLWKNHGKFLSSAQKVKEDRRIGQTSLFAITKESRHIQMEPLKPWALREKLDFEKDILGFYLSSHPMDPFTGLEKSLRCKPLRDMERDLEERRRAHYRADFFKRADGKRRGA